MSKFDINEEITDCPFDWGGIDHRAIADGWYHFWGNTQITSFETDKKGRYVRDEDGKLIAHRTKIPRKLPRTWFNKQQEGQEY